MRRKGVQISRVRTVGSRLFASGIADLGSNKERLPGFGESSTGRKAKARSEQRKPKSE
jgi:hypothetical protein